MKNCILPLLQACLKPLAPFCALIAVVTCCALPTKAALVPFTLDPNQGGMVSITISEYQSPTLRADLTGGYSTGSVLLSGDSGVYHPEGFPEDFQGIQGAVFPAILGSTTASMPARNIQGVTLSGAGQSSQAGGELEGPGGMSGIIRYANVRSDIIGTSVTHVATHMATAIAEGNQPMAQVTGNLQVTVKSSLDDNSFDLLKIPLSTDDANEPEPYKDNGKADFSTEGGSIPGNSTFYTGGTGPTLINGPVTNWVEFNFKMKTNGSSSAGTAGGYATTQFSTSYAGWAYAIVPD